MKIAQNVAEKQSEWDRYRLGNAATVKPPERVIEAPPSVSDAASQAIDFLKRFDADGWHSLVRHNPETGAIGGQTFAPGAWGEMTAFVDEWNGRENLYFSANEPMPNSPHKKLTENDIGRIRALCADLDPEPGVPFDRARFDLDQTAERVQAARLAPTITIDSGGGNQYFWLLAEKLNAKDGGKDRARAQNRALEPIYGNDEVHSIDHIFRLPGTINLPNKRKRVAGRYARPAKLLFANERRYTIEEFETGIAQVGPSGGARQDTDPFVNEALGTIDLDSARTITSLDDLSSDLRARFEHACAKSERLTGLWAGDERFRGDDPSGSGWRLCLAQELARSVADKTFSAQDYVELAHAWPILVSADQYDLRQYARDWGRFGAPIIALRQSYYEPLPDNDDAEWPEPIDIFGDDDPMGLGEPPASSLPPIIDQFAQSEARRKGVSLAFAASAAIGVVAAAIGTSLRIQVRQKDTGWTEPAPLWFALVAEPGRAKSPTISEATRPLRELDSEHYRTFKRQHDIWAAATLAHKKRGGAPAPCAEPIMRRFTVDDVTFEKQARIHADNPRGLLRAPDELMGFFGSFGAYKASGDGDRTQMLRLFDGGPIMLDRVGAGSIRAEQALMGIVAGTQPEKIQKIARDLGADGMLQRFLFVLDDGKERQSLDEAPDERAAVSYRSLLRQLATATYDDATTLRMDTDAQAAFNQAAGHIDGLKGLVGMPTAWDGHVNKWGKFLPRLVLTFHCIDMFALFGRIDPTLPIGAMSVERAANFGRFLLRHSLAFYRQYFEPDPASEEARAFAGYLLTRPDIEVVTRRTLGQAQKSLRDDPSRIRVMKDLEVMGWLRLAEQGIGGPARCKVNPRIHTRFAERAEWERNERQAKQQRIKKAGAAKSWLRADNISETRSETDDRD